MGWEAEVALLTDPEPWAKATEDTDATMRIDKARTVDFNVITNSLSEKHAEAWTQSRPACSAKLANMRPQKIENSTSP